MSTDHSPPREPSRIRPYLVTSGRIGAITELLPFETNVTTKDSDTPASLRFEHRQVAEACVGRTVSIAELASELDLPLGVVGLLVSDLTEQGLLVAEEAQDADIEFIQMLIGGIEAL